MGSCRSEVVRVGVRVVSPGDSGVGVAVGVVRQDLPVGSGPSGELGRISGSVTVVWNLPCEGDLRNEPESVGSIIGSSSPLSVVSLSLPRPEGAIVPRRTHRTPRVGHPTR